ncbi:MAG TPA: DUF1566 domain-containing protein [Candidatus Acidoferrales bacterium]|nr:DUF1566 domain-containing protein [Candidatus Acidoferrales bacterium]
MRDCSSFHIIDGIRHPLVPLRRTISLTATFCGVALACAAAVSAAPTEHAYLLKTGQTQCDQGTGTLGACPGSPDGQEAALSKGIARQYVDNGDGTITDLKTGLMWEKLSRDGSIHDYGKSYDWYNAIKTKITALNSGKGFAGHTDWRLPNVNELHSLIDYGRQQPAVDPMFNKGCTVGCTAKKCGCTQSGYYWSSTSDAVKQNGAWLVGFAEGYVGAVYKDRVMFVRAVRGGP